MKVVLIALTVIGFDADNLRVISQQRITQFDTLEECERVALGMDKELASNLYLIHLCSYN